MLPKVIIEGEARPEVRYRIVKLPQGPRYVLEMTDYKDAMGNPLWTRPSDIKDALNVVVNALANILQNVDDHLCVMIVTEHYDTFGSDIVDLGSAGDDHASALVHLKHLCELLRHFGYPIITKEFIVKRFVSGSPPAKPIDVALKNEGSYHLLKILKSPSVESLHSDFLWWLHYELSSSNEHRSITELVNAALSERSEQG